MEGRSAGRGRAASRRWSRGSTSSRASTAPVTRRPICCDAKAFLLPPPRFEPPAGPPPKEGEPVQQGGRRVRPGRGAGRMATEYLSEVRSELNSRSTRTTLDELKKQGLEQVRVIRSSQILQMIERSVEVALAKRGANLSTKERDGVVEDSSKVLKEMMRAEMTAARTQDAAKLDEMRQAMTALQQEVASKEAQLAEAAAKHAELDA